MQIHAICLVKNEVDIVDQGLIAALAWVDHIYVFDNGSTDGTWEKVQALAKLHPAIVPWKQQAAPFSDGLRAQVFNAFAQQARTGDWWVRLDPDEFYAEDPRAFLEGVPAEYQGVWYASLSFYFSTEEARRYREDPAQFADDVPILDKCRHYFNHWSELRFVRHEAMGKWAGSEGWPEGLLGRIQCYPRRILCRHFPYRSPSQIDRRLNTRRASVLGGRVFGHEALANWAQTVDPAAIRQHRWKNPTYVADPVGLDAHWESRVVDAQNLSYDAHDGTFVINEDLMPSVVRPRPDFLSRLLDNRVTRRLGLRV